MKFIKLIRMALPFDGYAYRDASNKEIDYGRFIYFFK